MTEVQRRALAPLLGSLLLLLGAFGFQYLGGLAPCPLCLWQRWPHGAAILLGVLILFWPARPLAALAGLAVLGGAAIGLYHGGIERGWWQGPVTCTAPEPGAVPAGELVDQILATPVVLCDQVAWSWLGVSMAEWNALLSLVLAILWFRAAASRD